MVSEKKVNKLKVINKVGKSGKMWEKIYIFDFIQE